MTATLKFDPSGWMEINYINADGVVLQSTSYHPTQIDLIHADMLKHGLELAPEHEAQLASWVADYVPPPAPIPTLADFDTALTEHLDSVAQAKRYDNRIACMVRAGFPGPFQAEGQAFAEWCDACNALAYALLAEVQAGTRPLPDRTQALIDILPPMVWPD